MIKVLKYSILILIVLLFQKISFSQNDTTFSETKINKAYLKSYLLDTKDLVISPIKWKKKDWLIFSGTTVAIGGLITQDLKIQQYVQSNKTSGMDTISKYFLEPWGSGIYSMSTMALFYLHGTIFKNERSKRVSMLGVKSFLLSSMLVNIPKHLFNRNRPYHGDTPNPMVWNGPIPPDFESETLKHFYKKSFFSGHTTAIFSVASVVATEYRDKPIVPILSYTIASLSGLSRINDNKHWASDVLGGAFFGWAIGQFIYNQNNWKINIIPYRNNDSQGLSVFYVLN